MEKRNSKQVFDALLPPQMADKAIEVGINKATLDAGSMFALAVLAGAFIAMGSNFYTVTITGSNGPYGFTKLLGGLTFCLGLILVVVAGAELFTGNNLIVMAQVSRKITLNNLIRNWVVVYAGNFVGSVAGKGLSTREIEKLAYGYFRGGDRFRAQIEGGNLQWTLRRMKQLEPDPPDEGMSEAEWNVVRDLELVQKYIVRILSGLDREDLGSGSFHAHALLLIEGLLEKIDLFAHQIRSFHDRRAQERSGSYAR